MIKTDSTNLYGNTFTDMYTTQHVLGKKQYELTDHLGNVLATVSDKRACDSLSSYGVPAGTTDTIETWKPIVVAAYDYYPFGEYMPTRYTNDSTVHCYNATLPELVHTIFYTPWVAWPLFSTGGITPVGPGATVSSPDGSVMVLSTTSVGEGFTTDVGGLHPGMSASVTIDLSAINGSFTATLTDDSTSTVIGSANLYSTQGNRIEYSVPFTAQSHSATLSFLGSSAGSGGTVVAFGEPHDTMILENVVTLVCDEDWYRYGYNGQMKNNQVAGLGNHYGFKQREYDSRTGRFISVDPIFKKYPWNSTFAFAENDVIRAKDLEGLEKYIVTLTGAQGRGWISLNPERSQWDAGLLSYEGEFNNDGSRLVYQQPQMTQEANAINFIENNRAAEDAHVREIQSSTTMTESQKQTAIYQVGHTTGADLNYTITPSFGPSNATITNNSAIAPSINWLGTRLANNPNLNLTITANLGSTGPDNITPTPATPLTDLVSGTGITGTQLSLNRGNAVSTLLLNSNSSVKSSQVNVGIGQSLSGANNRNANLIFNYQNNSNSKQNK